MNGHLPVKVMAHGLWLATVTLVFMAGCAGASHPSATPGVHYDPQSLGKHSLKPVVDANVQVGQTLDALCLAGGGDRVSRAEGTVENRTTHLNVNTTFSPAAAYTGLQIGFVLDSNGAPSAADNDRTIHWLPALFSSGAQRVEVSSGESETEHVRWAFYFQINPGRSELCFTGAGEGAFHLKIEARP